MMQRKPRRFKRRSNRGHHLSRNDGMQNRLRPNHFSNGQAINNFRMIQSPEKLYEKYTALAKEALSSGDKTLSENYLQHADHFMRIIDEKNKNRNINKLNFANKQETDNKQETENKNVSENIEDKKTEIYKNNKV